jgi:protein TonB
MIATTLRRCALLAALALPASPHAAPGQPPSDATIDEGQRRIKDMEEQQRQLIEQVRQQLQAARVDPAKLARGDPEALAQEKRRQELARMLATIEQRVNEENARPRKRYLSPATLGPIYAPYYHTMRCKIEAYGTANFPQADGRKLYGKLLIALLVHHDGRLLEARVVQSSGNPALDQQAEHLAHASAPFAPFTPAMREDTDQFDVTARFDFRNKASLEADASTACD